MALAQAAQSNPNPTHHDPASAGFLKSGMMRKTDRTVLNGL
jgi:hypothetical protein